MASAAVVAVRLKVSLGGFFLSLELYCIESTVARPELEVLTAPQALWIWIFVHELR